MKFKSIKKNNFIFLKIFAVSKKNQFGKTYALKVTPRVLHSIEELMIGIKAKKCRFLLETKAAFPTKVNYIFKNLTFMMLDDNKLINKP